MPHIFISYRHDDVDFAENVKHRVEKAGFDVWMDSDKLNAGEDWREGIDQGIKTAAALIVVMTPEAKASEYVTYEWAFAWGAGVPVIPIMLRSTSLHPRLEALQFLDFTNRARPWDRLLARLEQVGATSSQSKAATRHKLPNYLQQAIDDLDDADVTKRSEAIDTLGRISLPEAREALVAALEHPLQDMPFKVAIKLAKLKDQRAIPILLERLKSNEYLIMESAAMALSNYLKT